MELKQPRSFHDQIEILRERGMIIDNEKSAEKFLASNNYYHVNIYFHKLMDRNDHFCRGTRFSQVEAIYSNDSWLRNRIITLLEPIEINMRSQLAYYLGFSYGPDAFYQINIYKDKVSYRNIFEKFEYYVRRNQSDAVIMHHKLNYEGRFPIWVVVEYLSFSTLSKYFSTLLEKDKKIIAKNSYQINGLLLSNWLHSLSHLRNVCAHYGYLYRRKFDINPTLERIISKGVMKNDHLFGFLLAMKRLSEKSLWNNFIQQIISGEKTHAAFHLREYGFPDDWKTFLVE